MFSRKISYALITKRSMDFFYSGPNGWEEGGVEFPWSSVWGKLKGTASIFFFFKKPIALPWKDLCAVREKVL